MTYPLASLVNLPRIEVIPDLKPYANCVLIIFFISGSVALIPAYFQTKNTSVSRQN